MLWLRPPIVAGRFYPKEKAKLVAMLSEFCAPTNERHSAIAVVAPHAGYIYSGRFAGEVYRRVAVPKTVVVLCPNHTGRGPRISVWSEGLWETPLGRVPVAQALAKEILRAWGVHDGDMLAHVAEHAIEVHLPFFQYLRPDVEIVPVVLGPLAKDRAVSLGTGLANAIQKFGEPCLIVASTDMSHFISSEEAKKLDALALKEIELLEPQKLYETVAEKGISMCGFIPTTVALTAAKQLGAHSARTVCYGNSGEVTGDERSVVAYASAIIE